MLWHFFFRTENKRFDEHWKDRPAHQLRLALSIDTSLTEAIEAAHRAGVAKGSWRSGIFEVQNGTGIYRHVDERSIERSPQSKTIFQTWEQLEALEGE